MQAVGGGEEGASFVFETTSKDVPPVMVFTFPPDFERRAHRQKQRETIRQWLFQLAQLLFRALKIITAFGLMLSLFILSVAAVIGMIAAFIALTRVESSGNSHRNHRAHLIRQLQSICYTARQFLWCYALLAPSGDDYGNDYSTGRDPFFREVAYDIALFSSVFCSSPGSLFWWFRFREWQHRRHRIQSHISRGWSGRSVQVIPSDVEGVSLVHRGTWFEENSLHDDNRSGTPTNHRHSVAYASAISNENDMNHRGLLSMVVEFLFGPTPMNPGPSITERWKLRAVVLVKEIRRQQSTQQTQQHLPLSTEFMGAVPIPFLLPYCDFVPASLTDTAHVIQATLPIVSHFNGVPSTEQNKTDLPSTFSFPDTSPALKICFSFPELMAESEAVERYVSYLHDIDARDSADGDDQWLAVLYHRSDPMVEEKHSRGTRTTATGQNQPKASIPLFLRERPYRLTGLSSTQFFHCVFLGSLNLIGVWSLKYSFAPGGVLELRPGSWLFYILQRCLVPTLLFYAYLFFLLPLSRLVIILVVNRFRHRRNHQRKEFAHRTSEYQPTQQQNVQE
jgi:hypothetical protein